ncbi:MAG: hypothetical protein HY985_11015 [Magnetospirillum sp.]|nr:hypothetical protein [Magnetospirillum sp.]
MKITVVSKSPPGGRCTLYMAYARTIAECCGGAVEVVYPAAGAAPQPPALLVGEGAIAPADGLILSPMDVHSGLAALAVPVAQWPHLLERLEAVETSFLEGCGS